LRLLRSSGWRTTLPATGRSGHGSGAARCANARLGATIKHASAQTATAKARQRRLNILSMSATPGSQRKDDQLQLYASHEKAKSGIFADPAAFLMNLP
jgi:hypothetical protein